MAGVPEWSSAELDAVMDIYARRGCAPCWKPISMELRERNADGSLNMSLAQKGLWRSNNAVMNKVKEMNFKAESDACDAALAAHATEPVRSC
jgi:hypothetical protein